MGLQAEERDVSRILAHNILPFFRISFCTPFKSEESLN